MELDALVRLLCSRSGHTGAKPSGKRKRVHESDVERLQAKLSEFKQAVLPDPKMGRITAVKKALEIVGKDVRAMPDATQLREELASVASEDCCVCVTPLAGEMIMRLRCDHLVHSRCMHSWAQEQMQARKQQRDLERRGRESSESLGVDPTPTCPLCREKVF